jgi:hypothetical protein
MLKPLLANMGLASEVGNVARTKAREMKRKRRAMAEKRMWVKGVWVVSVQERS